MDATPLAISPRLSAYARHLGEDGRAWLDGLPDLIAELETRWSITVGEPLPEAGEGYVAWAERTDGTPAVLKLTVPRPHRRNEIEILQRANGHGYALLLEADLDRHAMLLEALGPTLSSLHLPPEQTIKAQTAALRQAWALPVDEATLWFGERKATDLAGLIERNWNEFGRPSSRAVVDQALRYAERRSRAYDPEQCVYAHGDPHAGNALQVRRPRIGAESGFVFIDPDGGAIEPAYDLGVVLRDWDGELAAANDPLYFAQTICSHLAESTGVDRQAIWEWGFIERVATGLYVLEFGQAWGLDKLANAEHLLQTDLERISVGVFAALREELRRNCSVNSGRMSEQANPQGHESRSALRRKGREVAMGKTLVVSLAQVAAAAAITFAGDSVSSSWADSSEEFAPGAGIPYALALLLFAPLGAMIIGPLVAVRLRLAAPGIYSLSFIAGYLVWLLALWHPGRSGNVLFLLLVLAAVNLLIGYSTGMHRSWTPPPGTSSSAS